MQRTPQHFGQKYWLLPIWPKRGDVSKFSSQITKRENSESTEELVSSGAISGGAGTEPSDGRRAFLAPRHIGTARLRMVRLQTKSSLQYTATSARSAVASSRRRYPRYSLSINRGTNSVARLVAPIHVVINAAMSPCLRGEFIGVCWQCKAIDGPHKM